VLRPFETLSLVAFANEEVTEMDGKRSKRVDGVIVSGERRSKRSAESMEDSEPKKVKRHFPKVMVLGTRGITYR